MPRTHGAADERRDGALRGGGGGVQFPTGTTGRSWPGGELGLWSVRGADSGEAPTLCIVGGTATGGLGGGGGAEAGMTTVRGDSTMRGGSVRRVGDPSEGNAGTGFVLKW